MTAAEAPTMPIKDKSARWMNLAMLALIAGALIAGVWITYQNVDAERVSREKAQASSQVLAELRDIYQATLRAETGQRGYMITLDRRYLAPYRVGRGEVLPAIGNLHALVGVDATPRQTALIAEIDLQANRKLDELDKTVAMLERGELLDARRLLLTDAGQEAMEALRVAIGEMAAIEQLELNDTLAATAQVQARTVPLLGVLLFLVFVFAIFGARLASRAARAEAEAAQAQTLAEAHDRADLLARELNHRVKNLFAVILAIIQMSGRGKPEAADLLQSISQRVRALLTAHEVTQGALDQPVASLRDLIETTLSPYVSQSQPVTLDGEPLVLPAKAATPLGLVLHELTTNTVKYGAWAQSGALQVSWHEDGEDIHIIWVETGCKNADQANSNGFGSLLMTSAARQLGGRIERSISAGGCEVTIVFPRALTTASA